jgi:hypothetical protein
VSEAERAYFEQFTGEEEPPKHWALCSSGYIRKFYASADEARVAAWLYNARPTAQVYEDFQVLYAPPERMLLMPIFPLAGL